MTVAKISMKKAALSNVYESFRASVTRLREEVDIWHSWDDATERGYAALGPKRHVLAQQELTLSSLENLVTSKKERDRKGLKKDGTRLLLAMCPECGYKIRASAMWLAIGIPKCPNSMCKRFDVNMEEDQSFSAMGEELSVKDAMEGYEPGNGKSRLNEEANVDAFPDASGMEDVDAILEEMKAKKQ